MDWQSNEPTCPAKDKHKEHKTSPEDSDTKGEILWPCKETWQPAKGDSWGQSWRQKRQREEKNELDGQHQDSSGATNQHLRRVDPVSEEVARHDTQPRKREGTWIDR